MDDDILLWCLFSYLVHDYTTLPFSHINILLIRGLMRLNLASLYRSLKINKSFCPAGIRAARVPSYSPGSIAEYAVTQILALAKECSIF